MNTHNVNPPQVFNYRGYEITFLNGESVMVNATDMAKAFAKTTKDYLRTKSANELIEAVSVRRKCLTTDLVVIVQGGSKQGTWMHETIALDFAQWLSVDFKLWCNDRIKEVLTKGASYLQGLPNFNNPAEAARAWADVYEKKLQLEERTELQQKELQMAAPKVDYYENVLSSKTTYNTNQIAKELGMSAISLNKRLHQLGVQYKQGETWLLYAKYQNKGYTKTNTYWYNTNSGEKGTSMQTVWSEKGREFIHEIIAKHGRTKTIPVSE